MKAKTKEELAEKYNIGNPSEKEDKYSDYLNLQNWFDLDFDDAEELVYKYDVNYIDVVYNNYKEAFNYSQKEREIFADWIELSSGKIVAIKNLD